LSDGAIPCIHNCSAIPQSVWNLKEERMVERRKELNRRYQRKKKMTKLKAKLAAATDPKDREAILGKIRIISPWWEEPAKNA